MAANLYPVVRIRGYIMTGMDAAGSIGSFGDQQSYDAIPVGLCVIDTNMRFVRVNAALAQMNGVSVAGHIGRLVSEVVPNLDLPARQLMQEVVASGDVVGPFEIIGETAAEPGKTRYWTEIWSPLFNRDGRVVAASIAAFDVTDRKILEHQKDEALRDAERRLSQQTAIAELSQTALGTRDLQKVLELAVQVASQELQVPLTKILAFQDSADRLKLVAGIGWLPGLVGEAFVGTEAESQAGFTLDAGRLVIVEDLRRETRFSGPALLHQHGVISGMSVPIEGANGRPFGVFGVHTTGQHVFDLADQNFFISLSAIVSNAVRNTEARSQRTLLIREMAHRAGNMLQLVSSIASQTFSKSTNLETAKSAFSERLSALARANHVIAQEGWASTRFSRVVEETLAPFLSQVEVVGRDILLPAELSFDLGLVLNELATNSCKYGSLGTVDASVELAWEIEQDERGQTLHLQWKDTHRRDALAAKPASSGFGSRLIRLLVENKWRGTIEIDDGEIYLIAFAIPVDLNAKTDSTLRL
jgi:PAS domain S-box-containing protein